METAQKLVIIALLLGSILIGAVVAIKLKRDSKITYSSIEDKLQALLQLRSYEEAAQVLRDMLPEYNVKVRGNVARIDNIELELTSSGIWISEDNSGWRSLVYDMHQLRTDIKYYMEKPNARTN